MPYAALAEKLQSVPEQYFAQVSAFLDLLLSLPAPADDKPVRRQPSGHPIPGLAKGEFRYPDDINLGDDEVAELFGV